ncbi:hypothetical protein [Streptomyces uncialis]|uniref:hypothetical protein n=1 Tax=Streptomyces uncialis TaxID=1048205 RepID=UPI00386F6054|nr:hypothetical protein OG924_05610 [Streptomyces uncialis]
MSPLVLPAAAPSVLVPTGRDLSNLVVLCAREPGHDPRDGHLGTVLDHGTHYWS